MVIFVSSILAYALLLLGPGFVFCIWRDIHRNRFILSFGISISMFVISQVPFRVLGLDVTDWAIVYCAGTLGIGLLGLFSLQREYMRDFPTTRRIRSRRRSIMLSWVFCLGLFSFYHLIVGPYTEIPSDFWTRLGEVTEQALVYQTGAFYPNTEIGPLLNDSLYVPFLHATVAELFGVSPLRTVGSATLAASLLFLSTVYWLSLKIYSRARLGYKKKTGIAVLAVFLTVLVFGVASFSYIRYYAFFPHIINMSLMLVVVSIFYDACVIRKSDKRHFAIIAVLLLAMALINKQEALLAVITVSLMMIWNMLHSVLRGSYRRFDWKMWASIFGISTIVVWVLVLITSFVGVDRSQWGEPHLIDLGDFIPFLKGWPIANPAMRFWETIGLFGVVIYVWFLSRHSWFSGNHFVNAMMFSPIATLFNPIFVLLFLRMASWDPLWRMGFLVPIPLVAAFLVVRSWSSIMSTRLGVRSLTDKLLVFILLVLLIPFQLGSVVNSASRLPSLQNVNRDNGALLWMDLIEYVDKLSGEYVFVTDNVTNYVLHMATRHRGHRAAKAGWQTRYDAFRGDYRDRLTYYKRDGELVIVNQRDGESSLNGKLSGHWREDILKVSTLYPPKLAEFLNTNPEEFQLLWEKDGISVFRIKEDGRG